MATGNEADLQTFENWKNQKARKSHHYVKAIHHINFDMY
jgi:hypothetical protein